MIDLQPLTTAESTPETHDFGREEAMASIRACAKAWIPGIS